MSRLNNLFASLLFIGAAALSGCTQYTIGPPIDLTKYSAETYTTTNMLTVDHARLAIPEGWHFHKKKKGEPDEVLFWMTDKSGTSTKGIMRMNTFDFAVDMNRLGPVYATTAMSDFVDRNVRETEVAGRVAQMVDGKHSNDKIERISTLISMGSGSVAEISFLSSSNRLRSNPDQVYAILNSYALTSGDLSERRIRGTFSFKCTNGTFAWLDDVEGPFVNKGFQIAAVTKSAAGERDVVVIDVAQVATTSFRDVVKVAAYKIPEFETIIRIGGLELPARAIADEEKQDSVSDASYVNKKIVAAKYLFTYKEQNYSVGIFWVIKSGYPADVKSLQEDRGIGAALNTYFYHDG